MHFRIRLRRTLLSLLATNPLAPAKVRDDQLRLLAATRSPPPPPRAVAAVGAARRLVSSGGRLLMLLPSLQFLCDLRPALRPKTLEHPLWLSRLQAQRRLLLGTEGPSCHAPAPPAGSAASAQARKLSAGRAGTTKRLCAGTTCSPRASLSHHRHPTPASSLAATRTSAVGRAPLPPPGLGGFQPLPAPSQPSQQTISGGTLYAPLPPPSTIAASATSIPACQLIKRDNSLLQPRSNTAAPTGSPSSSPQQQPQQQPERLWQSPDDPDDSGCEWCRRAPHSRLRLLPACPPWDTTDRRRCNNN